MSHYTAPSGLTGELRKIRGRELVALTEARESDNADENGLAPILNGCWLSTIDPGPYRFMEAGDARPPWGRILKGDVVATMVKLRRWSTWADFDFDVQCKKCSENIRWTVNLDTDLKYKMLPASSAERIREGKPFEHVVDGRTVTFDLQTIAHESRAAAMMKRQRRTGTATPVDLIYAQTRTVEGIPPTDDRKVWAFIADLSQGDLYEMIDAYADPDCGIQTEIKIRCQGCRLVQAIDLPLLGRQFFAHRRAKPKAEEMEEGEEAEMAGSSAGG